MTALGESNARLAAEESRIGNPMVRSIMSRAVSVQKMRGRKLGIGGAAAPSIELTSLGKRDSLATPGHQLHALDERGSNPSARPSHRVMLSNPLATTMEAPDFFAVSPCSLMASAWKKNSPDTARWGV